jgi:hypothetical protein
MIINALQNPPANRSGLGQGASVVCPDQNPEIMDKLAKHPFIV